MQQKKAAEGPLKNPIAMTSQWHENRLSVSGHGQTTNKFGRATLRGEFELFQQPRRMCFLAAKRAESVLFWSGERAGVRL